MTFDLVRAGWPNTVAILALAIMPMLALTAAPERRIPVQQTEAATICLTAAECPMTLAAAGPDTVLE